MAERSRGTLITHSSNFFAEVDSVDIDGMERAAIETTHLRTALNTVSSVNTDAASRTYIPSDIMSPGQVRISMFHSHSSRPPIDSVEETMTLTAAVQRNQTVGATLVGSAFMTSYSISYKLGEKTMATAVLQFTGPVTFTAGS